MNFPKPTDLGGAPLWENYIVAQAVAASRGQIPEHTLAFGVEVQGCHIRLRFQISEATEGDMEDIADIVSEMEALVGGAVEVASSLEVRSSRQITPTDGVRWIYLART